VADLGAHGIFIFRIPLNGQVNNRFLVFMLQKTECDKGTSGTPLSCLSGNVLEIQGNSCPSLTQRETSGIRVGVTRQYPWTDRYRSTLFFRASANCTFSPLEIFELEYPRIIPRQILIGVPRAGTERSQPTVPLKSDPGRDVFGCIDFIRELSVVSFFSLSSAPIF
jgi:hypothetical protein